MEYQCQILFVSFLVTSTCSSPFRLFYTGCEYVTQTRCLLLAFRSDPCYEAVLSVDKLLFNLSVLLAINAREQQYRDRLYRGLTVTYGGSRDTGASADAMHA